jgi:hypothetical protein
MVLTALALVAGAIWMRRRGGSTKQLSLMLLLAVVIAVNVAIWTLPDASGDAPVNQLPD